VKRILVILGFSAWCAAGFCENLPLNELGSPFSAPKLTVIWKAEPKVASRLWIYRIVPTRFPPAVISNLIALGGFTAKDQIKDSSGEQFASPDGTRHLRFDSASGAIDYTDDGVVHSGETAASVDVPGENELLGLTTAFLPKLGLKTSDIKKMANGVDPEFSFFEPQMTMFTMHGVLVTNVPQRSVFFRRALGGGAVVGNDDGGNGWIYFASHKAISKIALKWPALEPYKSYPTADPKTIAEWIHHGKARHGFISMNIGDLNWPMLKSMTVTKAELCYVTGKLYVFPLLSLWTTADTGSGTVDVEIDCPIVDQTKL
jgi:hypothetical protein